VLAVLTVFLSTLLELFTSLYASSYTLLHHPTSSSIDSHHGCAGFSRLRYIAPQVYVKIKMDFR
jgi:hypothetical protein